MRIVSSTLRPVLVSLFLFTILLGGVYPALSTLILQLAFPAQSAGSLLVSRDGTPLGSALIGQNASDPKYFWGRLSATSSYAYNASASSGSNLGADNPALMDAVKARLAALRQADPANAAPVPVDLVTASASGLDPEISPAAARYQIARVAAARHVDAATVQRAVEAATSGRQFGILGEARVNVLRLNLMLDGKL